MTLEDLAVILKTSDSEEKIDRYRKDIELIFPKVQIMFDFDQKNSAHQFNLWDHSLHTVLNIPRSLPDDMLYVAALLHDIGKPTSQCKGKKRGDVDMHYPGHTVKSMAIVRDEIIPELYSQGIQMLSEDKERLLYYIKNHDSRISLLKETWKPFLQKNTKEEFKNLMFLQVADAKAHIQIHVVVERIRVCSKIIEELDNFLNAKACVAGE